jgi:hypothetical protein
VTEPPSPYPEFIGQPVSFCPPEGMDVAEMQLSPEDFERNRLIDFRLTGCSSRRAVVSSDGDGTFTIEDPAGSDKFVAFPLEGLHPDYFDRRMRVKFPDWGDSEFELRAEAFGEPVSSP